MKNKKSNVWGFAKAKLQAKIIISLLTIIFAVTGFSMTACEDGGGSGSPLPPPHQSSAFMLISGR
ncbi:hypothetical protein [Treponema sp. R6D11]